MKTFGLVFGKRLLIFREMVVSVQLRKRSRTNYIAVGYDPIAASVVHHRCC